jgi:PAS domain-containing protein
MWLTVALGVAVLAFLLARILLVTRSTAAVWYSISLGIALSAILYEVVAAALDFKVLIAAVNNVTAALASSLMAALAIAEQMRQERLGRVKAETELRSTYEAIPIGLFTLDANGIFLRGNPALRNMLGVDPSRAGNETGRAFRAQAHGPGCRIWSCAGPAKNWKFADSSRMTRKSWRFLVKATLAEDKIEGRCRTLPNAPRRRPDCASWRRTIP